MAKVREDLVGSVLAYNESDDYKPLTAGQKIPKGYFVGGHAVEGGDPADQSPPWAQRNAEAVEYVDPLQAAVDAGASPEEILAAVAERLGIQVPAEGSQDAQHGAHAQQATAPGDGAADGSAETLTPPPVAGAGSGTDEWRDYAVKAAAAKGLSLEFDADAKRGDIIEALKGAGIATE